MRHFYGPVWLDEILATHPVAARTGGTYKARITLRGGVETVTTANALTVIASIEVYPPHWDAHGASAGLRRDHDMVKVQWEVGA